MKKKTTPKKAKAKSKTPASKVGQNAAIKRALIEKGGLNKEWARKHLVVIS